MDINNMIDFIYKSPTAFHAVINIENILKDNNFKELKENEKWNVSPYGKYYFKKHDSSIIAFEIGEQNIKDYGFNLIGAHTDAPTFKIKPASDIIDSNNYIKLNTEKYGGAIMGTWFDRPLSISGKIYLKSDDILNPEELYVFIERPILVIPNLAIHMNREINDGIKLNAQKDVLPILGFVNEELENNNYLLNLIANEYKFDLNDIIDFELFLHGTTKGCTVGLNNEMILSGRLDDLSMVYTGLQSIINSSKSKATKVLVCLDHEEIGSMTAEGANSNILINTLERILLATNDKEKESLFIALSNSLMISADLAHAHHPNYGEKTDITNKPLLGKGPVIKYSSNRKYSTDGYIASVIKSICKENDIKLQTYVNRSDIVGGSTIGPITASKLNIPIADMGVGILGMHSIMETGSVEDYVNIQKLFEKFYELRG